jgi:3-methyl-2-oxobutanoate hydroxymethyltransferase
MTTIALKELKRKKEPITMVTAYDYPTAKLLDEVGIDILLVGDSLGMVVLGYESTLPVTVEDMLHHTKPVVRGSEKAMVVTDLPFLSYHGSFDRTIDACKRLIQEGGAQAVKLEGGTEITDTISRLTRAGVPVMGHIGLTPQSVYQLGGYKVQGKDSVSASKLLEDAKRLEQAGVFAIVLECMPTRLAQEITQAVEVPIIGIGAGIECDGQVLVFHDLMGYGSRINPKFVKQYGNLSSLIKDAISSYQQEVKQRLFPTKAHSFNMKDEVIKQLYGPGGIDG